MAMSAVAGCSNQGSLSGKVTYKGTPLNGGQVSFVGANNVTRTAMIDADGNYSIDKVPVGELKIGVVTAAAKIPVPGMAKKMDASKMGGPAGASAQEPAKGTNIPAKYNDPEKSGLTYTMKSGAHKHDIDLP
jgi:hypothetical protein